MSKWPTKKLGEVARVFAGSSAPQGREYFEKGLYPFTRVSDLNGSKTKNLEVIRDLINDYAVKELKPILAKKGTLLFPKSGAAVATNSRAILAKDSFIVSHLAAIEPKEILQDWLWYYLLDFDMTEFSANSAYPSLQLSQIKNIPLPVPPIKDQQRIVNKIEGLFKKIDEVQELHHHSQKDASALVPAALNKIFSQGKVKNWKEFTLGEVCEIARGGSPRPISDYLTESADGINWVKISDATNSTKYIYKTEQKIKKGGIVKTRLVKPGDFILTNSMSYGRPYIMKTSGAIHDGWLLLRPKSLLNEEYLYYFLSSKEIYNQFTNLAGGAVVKNLNSNLVRSVKILVPSLLEQERIAKQMDIFSEKSKLLQELQGHMVKDLQALRQSILYKAFAGELV